MGSFVASRRTFLFIVVTTLLLFATPSAHGGAFGNVVAFGDSLSDNGNLYRWTGGVIPDSDYFEGRFSNGFVWVEYLAMNLGAELDDFAFGGASTGGGLFPPGLNRQIATWQTHSGLDQDLFTIWAGANDYLRLGRTDAQTAVGSILSGLETLTGEGVSRILLLNMPDLGRTPDLLSETALARAEASAYSVDFNERIAESLASFSGEHPGVIIYFLDVYALFAELLTSPEMFGFQNSTEVSPNFGINYQNDGGYVFWDGVHPTTEAHAFLAQEAATLLSKDCARVAPDLTMDLFFADYAAVRFGLTLDYMGVIPGDPEGFYWEMDPATLGVEPDNIFGIDHIVVGDDLDLIVPCAEYGGTRYAFRLDFVEGAGAGTFLWRLDPSSLTIQ